MNACKPASRGTRPIWPMADSGGYGSDCYRIRKPRRGKGLRSDMIDRTAHKTTPPAPPRRRAFHVNSPPDFFHPSIPHMVFPRFSSLPPHQPRCVAAVPSPFFLGSGPHVSQSPVWRVASAVVAAWTVPKGSKASAAVAGLAAPVAPLPSIAVRGSVSRRRAMVAAPRC